ncbi:MAG TPA: hypothetical protein PLV83_00340 [Bacilli bacterium]|nr:hypothetical protein [Bacilli bacterium]
MILYRALIAEDLEEFRRTGKINSTLYRSYKDLKKAKNKKMTEINYQLCYNDKNKETMLSFIFGHVSGSLVSKAKRSPWISLTSSFTAAYKYASFEGCNKENMKRYIICFYYDDDKIINTSEDFNKKDFLNGNLINLSNGELSDYRIKGIITPYGESKDKVRTGKNIMFDKYSKTDKEFLIAYSLKPDNYILLNPNVQNKLLNTYNDDIEKKISDRLEKNKILIKRK